MLPPPITRGDTSCAPVTELLKSPATMISLKINEFSTSPPPFFTSTSFINPDKQFHMIEWSSLVHKRLHSTIFNVPQREKLCGRKRTRCRRHRANRQTESLTSSTQLDSFFSRTLTRTLASEEKISHHQSKWRRLQRDWKAK